MLSGEIEIIMLMVKMLTSAQGSYGLTSSGRQYASYQGIRYAEPPTGNQRYNM